MARRALVTLVAWVTTLGGAGPVAAVTQVTLDNGQPLAIQDITDGPDTGAIAAAGRDAFHGYGYIRFQGPADPILVTTPSQVVTGLGMQHDGHGRWTSTMPRNIGGIEISRSIEVVQNYVRYVDTFRNGSDHFLRMYVAFGGELGSGAATRVAASGIEGSWMVTIAGSTAAGPSSNSVVAIASTQPECNAAFGSLGDSNNGNPFLDAWTGDGNDGLTFVYYLGLRDGETASLAHFVYVGLAEEVPQPEGCGSAGHPGCTTPPGGSEITRARGVIAALAENPDFNDLTTTEYGRIRNWTCFRLATASGNRWVVPGPSYPIDYPDSGGLTRGGQADFYDFGALRLSRNTQFGDVTGFGLRPDGNGQLVTTTPVDAGPVRVTRSIRALPGTDFLRYVDAFTNVTSESVSTGVTWGGDLGPGQRTKVAATTSGDTTFGAGDNWVVTIDADFGPQAPARRSPIGVLFRNGCDPTFLGVGDFSAQVQFVPWAGDGDSNVGFHYVLSLEPGETRWLAYFVFMGLAEETSSPAFCGSDLYPACSMPVAGSETARAAAALSAMSAAPVFDDLPADVREGLANTNWWRCNDLLDCTVNGCDPAGGCFYVPDDALCDDGDPCTIDACTPDDCNGVPVTGLPAISCAFHRMVPGSRCDGQRLPRAIHRRFARGAKLVDAAVLTTTKPERRTVLLQRASRKMARVLQLIERVARRKRRPVSEDCIDQLRRRVQDAKDRADDPLSFVSGELGS